MTERWIQAVIKPTDSIYLSAVRRPVYRAIRNLITELEGKGFLQSFHFFHEYGNVELRIHIAPHVDVITAALVRDTISEHLAGCPGIAEHDISAYEPELKQYGTDGWPIAQALFEAYSRFTLTDFDPDADLGDWYSVGKMVHCLMNQYFANRNREAQFHADELCTLIAVGYGIKVAYDTEWKDCISSVWAGKGWKGKWNWEARNKRKNKRKAEVVQND